jgi:hypothetical protein
MKTCNHFQPALADPGPCLTCEREKDGRNKGPLASFAGGREGWRNGETVGETMRENKRLWEAEGMTGSNAPISEAPGSRWI